ncbi:hypothetical protein PR048_015855 [Dryococelus australis]|uniref:Uncharacterized protein n=1 Tax=Dryococelus australis TaxID=614101 RepID=A0ABQ9HI63_9NEOP|nr:hypothetical protein PR048_015855 [Dryococelus australis]
MDRSWLAKVLVNPLTRPDPSGRFCLGGTLSPKSTGTGTPDLGRSSCDYTSYVEESVSGCCGALEAVSSRGRWSH